MEADGEQSKADWIGWMMVWEPVEFIHIKLMTKKSNEFDVDKLRDERKAK